MYRYVMFCFVSSLIKQDSKSILLVLRTPRTVSTKDALGLHSFIKNIEMNSSNGHIFIYSRQHCISMNKFKVFMN